jgi:hypothetical protein
MKQMEDRFNWWAGYDYVFLNDEPFDDAFKEHTQRLTNAKCHYGLIEPDHWHQPDWIDEEKASAAREVSTITLETLRSWTDHRAITGNDPQEGYLRSQVSHPLMLS